MKKLINLNPNKMKEDIIGLTQGYMGILVLTIFHILMEYDICVPLFCKIVEVSG